MLLDDYKIRLQKMKPDLDNLEKAYDLKNTQEQITSLEKQAAAPDFWDDLENSQKVLQKTTRLKNTVTKYNTLMEKRKNLVSYAEK